MRKAIVSVFILLFLATGFMLRFYHFPSNPPSLNWDEVSFGYNAYSILKTGKDEFGKTYPTSFRSLDDYKLPVYMYATVVSEALFGLNDFAVRFPSALAGLLTVIVLYFLVKELITPNAKDQRSKTHDLRPTILPLLSAGLLFILPWHVQFSRMAAEANMGLFFFSCAMYTFILATKNKPLFFIFSFVLFGLSMYSYLSFRVMSVISLVVLCIYYRKNVFRLRMVNYLALIFLSILVIFLIRDSFAQGGHIRFNATSVFNLPEPYKQAKDEMFVDASKNINIARRILHDSPFFTSFLLVSRGYVSHFSPDFLFFDQGQKHHHAPLTGLVYLWMIPFFYIGLYWTYQKQKPLFWVMLVWLIISPIPSSVTADIPHAIRSVGMAVPIVIFSAAGVLSFFSWIQRFSKLWRIGCIAVFAVTVGFFTFQFFHQYDIHLPAESSDQWVYGRKEMTEYLKANEQKYDRIIISTRLQWPYIFYLYYSKFDPKEYLRLGGTKSGGWGEEANRFGKYEFHSFNFDKDENANSRVLYVGDPNEFPPSKSPIFIVRYLDNRPVIYFVTK